MIVKEFGKDFDEEIKQIEEINTHSFGKEKG